MPLADGYITMGRDKATLDRLLQAEARGAVVINSPRGVALCQNRLQLTRTLREAGVSVPPADGPDGYWLKRSCGSAEQHDDICFAADRTEMLSKLDAMQRRLGGDVMVQAHVKGDLLKFYGVGDADFFRVYYPGDDGISKFGDEQYNGRPAHYSFDHERLHAMAAAAARAAGIDVYGGDCVVTPGGDIYIIDFNDWPSFSRCCDEAAAAIAALADRRLTEAGKH